MPSSGRSSSNHSKPGVFSTAPARPRKRSSNRACLSGGTVIALIFTTLMPLPFPARAHGQSRDAARWRREHAPHRRPRLRPAGPRPGPTHRHAGGRLRRRARPRRRPSPASRRCWTAARRSPGRPAWTTRPRRRSSSAGPTRSSTPRPGCAFVGRAAGAGRRRRWCSPPARRTAPSPPRSPRPWPRAGSAAAGWTTSAWPACTACSPSRPTSPRPTSSSSSPGWTARCPAWSPGLTDRLVVAVPTSVGYGAAFEGLAALLTMLTACAPGRARRQHRQRLRRRASPPRGSCGRLSGSGRGRAAARSSSRTGSRAGRPRPAEAGDGGQQVRPPGQLGHAASASTSTRAVSPPRSRTRRFAHGQPGRRPAPRGAPASAASTRASPSADTGTP